MKSVHTDTQNISGTVGKSHAYVPTDPAGAPQLLYAYPAWEPPRWEAFPKKPYLSVAAALAKISSTGPASADAEPNNPPQPAQTESK